MLLCKATRGIGCRLWGEGRGGGAIEGDWRGGGARCGHLLGQVGGRALSGRGSMGSHRAKGWYWVGGHQVAGAWGGCAEPGGWHGVWAPSGGAGVWCK